MAKITIETELYKDDEARRVHDDVMARQKRHSFFYSVGDTFKFLAAIAMTSGMALSLPSFVGAINSGAGLGAALAAIPAAGIGIIGVAIAATAVAVASNYISSNLYTSANYDSLEANAQHTAKYLAKELEHEKLAEKAAENSTSKVVVVEHEQNARKDGKKWQDVVGAAAAMQEQGRA